MICSFWTAVSLASVAAVLGRWARRRRPVASPAATPPEAPDSGGWPSVPPRAAWRIYRRAVLSDALQ